VSSALKIILGMLAGLAALIVGLFLTLGGSGDDGDDGDTSLSDPQEVPGTIIGEGEAEKPDVEGADHCSLITQDEAEAVAGVALPPGTPTRAPAGQGEAGSCTYVKASGGGAAPTIVNVVVITKIPRSLFDSELAQDSPDAIDVDGPGAINKLLTPGVLTVWDDNVSVLVEVVTPAGRGSTDVLVDLAAQVLDRL